MLLGPKKRKEKIELLKKTYRLRNKSGAVFYFCSNCVNIFLIFIKLNDLIEQSKL